MTPPPGWNYDHLTPTLLDKEPSRNGLTARTTPRNPTASLVNVAVRGGLLDVRSWTRFAVLSSSIMRGLDRLRALARGRSVVGKAAQLRWRADRAKRLAPVLRPTPRFLLGEVLGGTGRYALPSGQNVVVRHRTRDLDIVADVLIAPYEYEPPPAIAHHLDRSLRILDLGANIGTFGTFALGRWNVHELRSFEADPANLAVLSRTIAVNNAEDRWTARHAAVSNATGHMTFMPGHFSESRAAEQGETGIEVMMVDLFGLEQNDDLLKIDIEGGEWAILCDRRMADLQIPVIVVEWHWRFAPLKDAHAAALGLLQRAGYQVQADRTGPQDGIGLIWASRS